MAITKISEKFSDKKNRFNSYINRPEIFDCDDFNIIKLFQYAIFREEGFNAKPYWKLPTFLLSIILFLKRLKLKKHFKLQKKEQIQILIPDLDRYVVNNNGKFCSRYFENIINHIPERSKILWLNTLQVKSKTAHDVQFSDFYDEYAFLPLNDDDKRLLKHLKSTYKKIVTSLKIEESKQKILSEIIQIFWQEYRAYRAFLEHYPNLKYAFVIPHYQKEALIYVLKRKHVKIIELQHGLIDENDMFYVYDKNILPVKNKALFADEMWTYGEYWKNVLLKGYEYDNNQIKIFGYYVFYEKNFSDEFKEFSKQLKSKYQAIIFATAQKNLETHLAEYLNFLINDSASKKYNICIIAKPHPNPAQDISLFLDNKYQNVFVVNYPMEWLFQICNIHVSIYSTTLFDALMFNVKNNFAIKHPLFADYVESIVNKGVAKEVNMNENVVDKYLQTDNKNISALSPDYFYAAPDYSLLEKTIK